MTDLHQIAQHEENLSLGTLLLDLLEDKKSQVEMFLGLLSEDFHF